MLQVALRAAWRQQKAAGLGLLEAYQSVGGVLGALAQEAETVRTKRLTVDDQTRLELIFVRLVRLGDTGGATRRAAALDEFDSSRQALLRRLGDDEHGRLVVVGENSAEIAHEALITQWPWLQGRLKDELRDVRQLDRLMSRSSEWIDHDPRTNDGPRLILIDFAVSGGFERQYRVLPVTLSCSGSRMASLGGIACNRRESRWS